MREASLEEVRLSKGSELLLRDRAEQTGCRCQDDMNRGRGRQLRLVAAKGLPGKNSGCEAPFISPRVSGCWYRYLPFRVRGADLCWVYFSKNYIFIPG